MRRVKRNAVATRRRTTVLTAHRMAERRRPRGNEGRRGARAIVIIFVATLATSMAATAAAAEAEPKEAEAKAPAEPAAAAKAEAPPSPPPPAKAPPPLLAGEPGWQMGFYGWLELDALYDSTQSFTESVLNNNISRPNTIAGDNPRFQGTAKDSRLGYKIVAPAFGAVKTSVQMEADFFGTVPSNATQDQSYTYASIRLRQYYARLETPIVDLLVGQTFDLFGWGGQGFFPSTPAFLGVMGEVFHRNVQVRLTKVIATAPVNIDIAAAGVRPATRDSGTPDVQAGLKLTINDWQGASAQGPRPAKAAPLALGVSAVGRRLAVTDFQSLAGDPQVVLGWGAVASAFIPIIPARGQDLSNTLSVTGEYSRGTGVSDLYLTLNGGVLFPSLPNPKNVLPAPVYTPNIDNGIVTFDVDGKVRTINWEGMMVNARYNLPFRAGKMLSLSGIFSRIKSNNAVALTPRQGQAFVWDKGQYIEGTLWWSITPAFQMALSYQTMAQTYGDGTLARNNRAEAAWWFFF
jgi:DcaP outer membrane protein